MTALIEDQQVVENKDVTSEAATEATEAEDSEKSRDFTKFTVKHAELAEYINANADFLKANLPAVTPGLVKAILALRTEHANTPEVKAAREIRKAALAEEKKQFAGLTTEQVKAEKAARRAEAQAEKLRARVEEAHSRG